MTDWLEEEEKAEKTNNYHDRMQDVLISTGIIPTSPSDNYVSSPKTILQMKELTDNIQYLHISTPKSPKKWDTNQIIDTPPPPSEKLQLPIFHLRPPPEMHQNQPPPPFNPPEVSRKNRNPMNDKYKRKLKFDRIKEKFPKFLATFSDKEWEEGIPKNVFLNRFITYFHFPISHAGLGQIKEMKEFCIPRRKRVNGKIIGVYKKRLNK